MKQLTIAMDYDETFTSDPSLWSNFVSNAKEAGHCVIMVTARRETEESVDQINGDLDKWRCQMPIYFTALGSKVQHMDRLGFKVDIWIEDDMMKAVHGH
ncbi:MAG: hypothetical protein AAGJ40_09540 [Planctomycetota bacterium]